MGQHAQALSEQVASWLEPGPGPGPGPGTQARNQLQFRDVVELLRTWHNI